LSTSRNESYPAWFPSGNQYAYVTDRTGASEIWLRSTAEGWDRPLVTENDFTEDKTEFFSGPSVSPDGQRIAYERMSRSGDVAVWISNLAGGTQVRLAPKEESAGFSGVSWSPDGNWIAWIHGTGGKYVLAKAKVGEGVPITLKANASGAYANAPKWSPDGQWITFDSLNGCYVISADGKNSRKTSDDSNVLQLWSKDGKVLYYLKEPAATVKLFKIDFATGKQQEISDLGILWDIRGASLSPDGKSIMSSFAQVTSDIWLLEGFERPVSFFDHFFRKQ
jgi:Tol biopolymer transport system component